MSEKDEVVEILKRAMSPPFKAVMGRGDGTVLVSGKNGWVWCRKLGKTELLMQAYNKAAPNIEDVIVYVQEARVQGIKGYEIVGVDYATSPSNIYPGVPPHAWTHEWRPGVGRDRVTIYPRAWGYLRAEPIATGSMNVWVTPGWIYYNGAYSYYRGGYSPSFGAPAGATWYQTLYLDPSDETLHITNGVTGGYGYAQVPSPPECMMPICAVESTGTFSAVTENMIEDIRLFMDYIEECGDGGGTEVHTHADDTEGGQLDWDDIWADGVHSHANAGEGGQLDWDDVWSDAVHSHTNAAEGGQLTAANIINVPAGGIAATDVQAAINELDTEKVGTHNILDGSVHPDSVAQAVSRGSLIYGDSTSKWNELILGASGTYLHSNGVDVQWVQIPASEVVNTPAGGIAATDVQAAINELDTEKAPATHTAQEPFDAHLNNPACRAYHSARLTIPNSTWTALAMDSERFDTDTIHNTVTNNSRLTCKTAGIYVISASIAWDGNLVGRRVLGVRLNGATLITNSEINPANDARGTNATTIYELAVNDYVECVAYQTSGGNLDILAAGNQSPEFGMARVG